MNGQKAKKKKRKDEVVVNISCLRYYSMVCIESPIMMILNKLVPSSF